MSVMTNIIDRMDLAELRLHRRWISDTQDLSPKAKAELGEYTDARIASLS